MDNFEKVLDRSDERWDRGAGARYAEQRGHKTAAGTCVGLAIVAAALNEWGSFTAAAFMAIVFVFMFLANRAKFAPMDKAVRDRQQAKRGDNGP